MLESTYTVVFIRYAKILPKKIGTGYMADEKKYNHMKCP